MCILWTMYENSETHEKRKNPKRLKQIKLNQMKWNRRAHCIYFHLPINIWVENEMKFNVFAQEQKPRHHCQLFFQWIQLPLQPNALKYVKRRKWWCRWYSVRPRQLYINLFSCYLYIVHTHKVWLIMIIIV